VDEAGHLVACDRMDAALWITPEIARAKANAAAAFRASTLELEERFNKGRLLFASNVATLGDVRLVFGKGGVPIVEDGRIVGAVGVSGAVPADNDHLIADAAAGQPTLPDTR
jgi:glc operon protein GlcG